jgi:hypothetical protein
MDARWGTRRQRFALCLLVAVGLVTALTINGWMQFHLGFGPLGSQH